MSISLNDMITEAIMAADARKAALARGIHLPILSNPAIKPVFAYGNYGYLNSVTPTRHINYTGFSKMSRYPEQIQEVKERMAAKRNGSLKVLDIGVAQGQEPLTHINTAFELSQNSAKTISDFLDLKTVDVLHFAPELPAEAKTLHPFVIRHLEHIYDPRSGKSIWDTPIEEAAEKLLKNGEKQDVILFNNVIQHICPDNEQDLEKTFQQLADLITPKGIICAETEGFLLTENPTVRGRIELLHKVLQDKNFVEIKKDIYEKH